MTEMNPMGETQYANIERKLLAVVYGCEMSHSYLYRRASTDHRSLEQIHKNTSRRQPLAFKECRCVYNPTTAWVVKYLPLREMVTADALPRLSRLDEREVPDLKVKVYYLIRITPAKIEKSLLKIRHSIRVTLQAIINKA